MLRESWQVKIFKYVCAPVPEGIFISLETWNTQTLAKIESGGFASILDHSIVFANIQLLVMRLSMLLVQRSRPTADSNLLLCLLKGLRTAPAEREQSVWTLEVLAFCSFCSVLLVFPGLSFQQKLYTVEMEEIHSRRGKILIQSLGLEPPRAHLFERIRSVYMEKERVLRPLMQSSENKPPEMLVFFLIFKGLNRMWLQAFFKVD